MAFPPRRLIFLFSLVTILCSTVLPFQRVHALADRPDHADLPALDVFIEQVRNGQAADLRGVYVERIFAAAVVQQPEGITDFVSPWREVLTQFRLASQLGSTGLLAHNNLAGKSFSHLQQGQELYLIYGDGHVARFMVSEILAYQALRPNQEESSFMELGSGTVLTASELFKHVYNRPGAVVLQTCLEMNDQLTGGRLFIIADPV